MKIDSFEVNMQASSSFVQKYEKSVSATAFSKTQDISDEELTKSQNLENKKIVFNSEDDLSIEDKIKKRVIEQLISELLSSNHNIKLFPSDYTKTEATTNDNPYLTNQNEWGFSYESKEEYYEKSTMNFSSTATIKTSNGEFNINLNLSYSKEFYSRNETRIEASGINSKNPFIVDFKDKINDLEGIKKDYNFEFDLNKNKETSDIPTLRQGDSFLALDKNGNNDIDDSGELFGIKTGDGFAELSVYDEDGNNWIDENDAIFKDLRVWEKDENGENSLISLADSGIGAIYLASVPSNINGNNNEQTSIFLKENGEAGVIGSVDFRV